MLLRLAVVLSTVPIYAVSVHHSVAFTAFGDLRHFIVSGLYEFELLELGEGTPHSNAVSRHAEIN